MKNLTRTKNRDWIKFKKIIYWKESFSYQPHKPVIERKYTIKTN